MSFSYSYGRNPYYDNFVWPAWITIPNDGDPFTSSSDYAFSLPLLDRNSFVFESNFKLPTSLSSIKAACVDGVNIKIHPYIAETVLSNVAYISQTNTEITITVANLEGGGSFANDTWYYVYHKVSAGPVFSTVISTVAPHVFLLYKDNAGAQNLTSKYLFSFRTNGSGMIYPFFKSGTYVMYLNARNLLLNGTATGALTSLDCTPFLPPFSHQLMLDFSFRNKKNPPPAIPLPNTCRIYNGMGSFIPILQCGTEYFPGNDSVTRTSQIPVVVNDPAQVIYYQILTVTMDPSTLTIDVVGYYE